MTKTKLEMVRGDTKKWDLTVTQVQNGVEAEADITGWTLWMTAKRIETDVDGDAVFQIHSPTDITITDPTHGVARITLPATATGALTAQSSLYFDVQGKDQVGGIHTVCKGTLKVYVDVTVTTT